MTPAGATAPLRNRQLIDVKKSTSGIRVSSYARYANDFACVKRCTFS
jgi:hypothetical protein